MYIGVDLMILGKIFVNSWKKFIYKDKSCGKRKFAYDKKKFFKSYICFGIFILIISFAIFRRFIYLDNYISSQIIKIKIFPIKPCKLYNCTNATSSLQD